MPIYEFYCADCHTVFSFLARSIHTAKRPACPQCGRAELERHLSSFAIAKQHQAETTTEQPPTDLDEARMERVLTELEQEAGSLDENDPRQMARMMRTLYDKAALPLDAQTAELIRRLEAGEDPEAIDAELGDAPDEPASEPASPGQRLRGLARQFRPPAVDDTLYDL